MGVDEPFRSRRILLVTAHPDDETIGAGAQLEHWKGRVDIVHVTDGAPRNPADALNAGCASVEEYAALRRREMLRAIAVALVPADRCHTLGIADQRASYSMKSVSESLLGLVERLNPGVVLTHPYEGGHPDHDACAFAARAAVRMARSRSATRDIRLWEFTSYHAGPNGIVTGRFLPNSSIPVLRYALGGELQRRKREMFECFESQRHMLVHFGVETECFRAAPGNDFTQPPHPGELHYERFDWGMTGPRWRELAGRALRELELVAHATNHP